MVLLAAAASSYKHLRDYQVQLVAMARTDDANESVGGRGTPLAGNPVGSGAWDAPTIAAPANGRDNIEASTQPSDSWVQKKPLTPLVGPHPSAVPERNNVATQKTSPQPKTRRAVDRARSSGRNKSSARNKNDEERGNWGVPLSEINEVSVIPMEAGASRGAPEPIADGGSSWDNVVVGMQNDGVVQKPKVSRSLVSVEKKPVIPAAVGQPSEWKEVPVPDSAVGHIIGKTHRTINALKRVPGIARISLVRAPEHSGQLVKVEGSSSEAIAKVVAQINRLVLRSWASTVYPQLSLTCLPRSRDGEDGDGQGVSLKLVTPEEYQLHMPAKLKRFVVQHAPQEFPEKKYFTLDSRISCDQVSDSAAVLTRKRRRGYADDFRAYILSSWDKSLYISSVSSCLEKILGGYPVDSITQPQIKIRVQLGKMFYYGTDLNVPETWNVSLSDMQSITSVDTLRPLFSSYCHVDTVERARKYLEDAGYKKQNADTTSQGTICAEVIDMDAPTKPSFNIRLMKRDKIASKINKKARRHAYVTFLRGKRLVDFQLRIQSREVEPPISENVRAAVFESWIERGGIEEPLVTPSGHHYYPVKVLHKVFERYKNNEDVEVILTQVSEVSTDQKEDPCGEMRWTITLQTSVPPRMVGGGLEFVIFSIEKFVNQADQLSMVVGAKLSEDS